MRNGLLAVFLLVLATPSHALEYDSYLDGRAASLRDDRFASLRDSSFASVPEDDYDLGFFSDHGEDGHDDAGFGADPRGCVAATSAQKAVVNQGNAKAAAFLGRCRETTGNSRWCDELLRPNPSSRGVFACTYGAEQPHQLIHPDERTWPNAWKAAQLVRDLEALGVRVAQIYNWWRPEPYNANVGGSKTRHPFGTAVDVRFASLPDMEKAHRLLCQFRKQGRLRALGYYGSTGLHFGVGDANPNTWGKDCP